MQGFAVQEVEAAVKHRDRQIDKYNELLMAVESKCEGETRHQTALRYIREAESNRGTGQAVNQLRSDEITEPSAAPDTV